MVILLGLAAAVLYGGGDFIGAAIGILLVAS